MNQLQITTVWVGNLVLLDENLINTCHNGLRTTCCARNGIVGGFLGYAENTRKTVEEENGLAVNKTASDNWERRYLDDM